MIWNLAIIWILLNALVVVWITPLKEQVSI